MEKNTYVRHQYRDQARMLSVVMLAVGRVAGTWDALGEYWLDAGINE